MWWKPLIQFIVESLILRLLFRKEPADSAFQNYVIDQIANKHIVRPNNQHKYASPVFSHIESGL